MRRVTTVLLILIGILLVSSHNMRAGQQEKSKHTIVPGVRVGDFTLGMSKDDVLSKLGEPEAIHLSEDEIVRRGEDGYTLNNLPRKYIMAFGDISFFIHDDSVKGIFVRSPLYKLSNGLKVGDSEQKIKQALGEDFQLEEDEGKEYLVSDAGRLAFEIHKKDRTVTEIIVFQPEGDRGDRDVSEQTIVPGVGMGDYTLDMNKDDILRRLGKPKNIHFGGEDYTLDNLPKRYFMFYDGISFFFNEEGITGISTNSPRYKFANGLKVGDLQDRIIQAFGEDFQLKELKRMDVLIYEEKGLRFEIDKRTKTIEEISVNQVKRNQDDSDALVSGKEIKLSEQQSGPIMFPKIDRRPKPDKRRRGEMTSLPKYNPDSTKPFQMDLRNYDLSELDLRDSIEDLMYANFDHGTVWPASDRMPPGFDWQKIMELGKNPGLGVRSLHQKGITGRGVKVAIIDQPLLVEHQEYAERLRLYEEIHIHSETEPQMHGPAVASIAVGKTVGVAPEAELFYIAQFNFDWEKGHAPTLRYLAQGIDRIVEINEQLPEGKKIRVISISKGWTPSHKEFKLITDAVQRACAAGMLVVCTSVELVHEGCDFDALGRPPLADPDVFESYEPGWFRAKSFWAGHSFPSEGLFWVPMDSRTTASPGGSDEYVFYRTGGFSWAVPYIAGVYALAVQVDPDMTPERFWALAARTGRTIELEREGKRRPLAPIIDPVALIISLQKK